MTASETELSEEPLKDVSEPMITWRQFLEETPPGRSVGISEFIKRSPPQSPRLNLAVLQLHCVNAACDGLRWYAPSSNHYFSSDTKQNIFLSYACRNCGRTYKTFAVRVGFTNEESNTGTGFKFGEDPAFGPPLPARVQRLLQPDRELLLKGRRCENQGLGVAAFAYYRRVVEDNKNRFLQEIKRVGERLGASDDLLQELDLAASEIQFTKAVERVRAALPPALMINGHNPLTLLHHALSKGVHDLSDNECLSLATSVRIVLTEFAERSAQALKDDAELKQAIARLQNP